MRLVVDANILYSVILKTDGRVAEVFFNTRPVLELVAPMLLENELRRHRPRMTKQMRKSTADVTMVQDLVLRRVALVDDGLISDEAWAVAEKLVRNVDPDDVDFVALALHLECPLWTGDLKLATALKRSPVKVVSTAELRAMHASR